MPASYGFQESEVLTQIAPELIQNNALSDPIFGYFPIVEQDAYMLRWTVDDNFRGLMALRGMDGAPPRVQRPGRNLYETRPGVFGEYFGLDERELTERAKGFPANMTVPIDVADLVREGQAVLTVRQVQRMKQMAWGLALTHALYLPLPTGGFGYEETFAGQTMATAVLWSDPLNSTPIHDLRQLQFVYGRGTSNNFQQTGEAWMNGRTAQYIMQNRNPADAGGIRADYGATVFNSVDDFNKILIASGAPKICIWEDSIQVGSNAGEPGFVNNNYQMLIPDGVVWVVAARPANEKPGRFIWSRHMVNGGGTKPYAFVKDFTKNNPMPNVPPTIEVHQGFNGGVAQTRPSQTVTMLVA